MTPFLHEVAKDIIKRYGTDYERLAFIFPNKRASLFFKKYLGKLLGRNIWAPSFFTISQVIDRYTKVQTPNQLTLLFYLYESFREIKKSRGKWDDNYTFDKFSTLGEILLKDFNDVDNYLVDPKSIFSNIKDLAEIEHQFFFLSEEEQEILRRYWSNFTVDKLSDEKERFLELWEDVPLIYNDFVNRLEKDGLAFSGMKYRKMAALLDEGTLQLTKYDKFVMVGFSALNAVERKFFKYLDTHQMAEFYWDDDKYYIDYPQQEAGLFLRKNRIAYSKSTKLDVPKNLLNEKKINIVGVPLFAAQAKLIPRLLELSGIGSEQLNEETAIVLADEHLLFPVLQSLPENVEKLNITMGFPLKETSLFALLEKVINLHALSANRGGAYHHKSVLGILRHPMLMELEQERCEELISSIIENNLSFVPPEHVFTSDESVFSTVFAPLNSPNDFLDRLLNLLHLLFSQNQQKEQGQMERIENEYIYHAYLSLQQIKEVLIKHAGVYSFNFLVNILRKTLSEVKIPFTGEPLQGLQVMGVLETRNIDFKNVVVLCMNEGIWPSQGRAPSFISESLRQAFQLPVSSQQDAIYAYLFYRLIQRAENITFVYNNLAEGAHNGEMSRLLLQLMYETELPISQYQFAQELSPSTSQPIRVKKNAYILDKLKHYTANAGASGLTPSAINTYIDCQLKFYFKYVAGIHEKDEVQEDVDAALLGTLMHATLEILYTEEILKKGRKDIQKNDFKLFREKLLFYVEQAFADTFKTDKKKPFKYRNEQLVMKEVVKSLSEIVLRIDEKLGSFELVSLEEKDAFISVVEVSANDTMYPVRIKGIIDRVDRFNGTVRVLDYKTGKADKHFADWDSVFSREVNERRKAVLQTFIYGMLFTDNVNAPLVFPGVYDVRSMTDANFSPHLAFGSGKNKTLIDESNFSSFLNEFKTRLKETLTELYNGAVDFNQTENLKHCSLCPYNAICSRAES